TWFAIDKWFPQVFGVWTSCGYTPELLFGITMAEGLLIISMVLALISLMIALAIFANKSLPAN
ncbi:MAG TPA: disulfide bond formation protein B, partial [Gammaproteobacteria bacterium]